MLKALYDFTAPYDGTLSFQQNEDFLVLKRTNKDTNWVHVINRNGDHGYIPANYVTAAENPTEEVLEFANRAVEVLNRNDKLSGKDKTVLLDNLHEVRSTCEQELREAGSVLTYQLATLIRNNTDCKFNDAVRASIAALSFLQGNVKDLQTLERMLGVDLNSVDKETRLATQDGGHLSSLVEIVMEVADDREISVDEDVWTDLLHVVSRADSVMSVAILERCHCAAVLRLIQHLQAETKWGKRELISEILYKVLQLDRRFTRFAMNSVLPTELAREIDMNRKENLRIHWAIRLLLILLCGEEPLSIPQREVFGKEFIDLLLQLLEEEAMKTADSRTENIDIVQDLTNIVLALNLQYIKFAHKEENPVIACLCKKIKADCLIEKVILLFNREEDPLKDYLNESDLEPDSVTHFMLGLFSNPKTGKIMYTADLQVVLDVLLRQLQDCSPGDNRRSSALKLLHALLQSSTYWDEPYRLADFSKTLTLMSEEQIRLGVSDLAMQNDRVTILKIFHDFPSVFTLNQR